MRRVNLRGLSLLPGRAKVMIMPPCTPAAIAMICIRQEGKAHSAPVELLPDVADGALLQDCLRHAKHDRKMLLSLTRWDSIVGVRTFSRVLESLDK